MPGIPESPASLFDVSGKTAIVTGATGSFGEMAAVTLARAGCNLVAAGGSSDKLDALVSRLGAEGRGAVGCALRPSSEENCQTLVAAALDNYGGLDILVVGSGINIVNPIEDMGQEQWQEVMDANVRDPWLLCKAAVPTFKEQGSGSVILVSSARSVLGHPAGYSAYCPSKSAVDGLVRALGCEWGSAGVTVNAIAPTVFRSPLTSWMFADDDRGRAAREGILSRIAMGRLGEPEDLAGAVLFLASDASNFMTGQILRPDGGYTAG